METQMLMEIQAIVEINRKFGALLEYLGKEDRAVVAIQDDLKRFHEEFGYRLIYDKENSATWGPFAYGIYRSVEEFENSVVDVCY